MANLKEIRRRITSVNNTRQITRAMKLVAAAKLRRAQEAAQGGQAYRERLDSIVRTLVSDLSGEFQHPLLEKSDEVKTRRVIVISGDRGLCGAYNTNVTKAVEANEFNKSVELEFVAIGKRSVSTAKRLGWNILSSYESLAENASEWPVEEMGNNVIDDFTAGKCQEVVLYYTKFVSALNQIVTRDVLLPFDVLEDSSSEVASSSKEESDSGVDERLLSAPVSYSSMPSDILHELVPMLIRTKLRQAGLESKASENAARMTAMEAATNNANELIDKLKLFYNRARQSAITTELIDIVGGAEAVQ